MYFFNARVRSPLTRAFFYFNNNPINTNSQVSTMQDANTTQETDTTQETSDINLATYIRQIKGIHMAGYYHTGDQLHIRFNITAEQLAKFSEEYLNSQFAGYDATKRGFLRLLKPRR